jgi:hypothetical protein
MTHANTLRIAMGLAAVLTIAAPGCALRSPLMKAPLVSETLDSVDPSVKHQELGPVSARYCPGEDPLVSRDKSQIGMLDEVIYRAQKDKNADYIRDADFSMEGNCVVLEGVAMK